MQEMQLKPKTALHGAEKVVEVNISRNRGEEVYKRVKTKMTKILEYVDKWYVNSLLVTNSYHFKFKMKQKAKYQKKVSKGHLLSCLVDSSIKNSYLILKGSLILNRKEM